MSLLNAAIASVRATPSLLREQPGAPTELLLDLIEALREAADDVGDFLEQRRLDEIQGRTRRSRRRPSSRALCLGLDDGGDAA